MKKLVLYLKNFSLSFGSRTAGNPWAGSSCRLGVMSAYRPGVRERLPIWVEERLPTWGVERQPGEYVAEFYSPPPGVLYKYKIR